MRLFFFFNDTATTEIYTLSLHDALPISARGAGASLCGWVRAGGRSVSARRVPAGRPHVQEPPLVGPSRSEEQTSELQSRLHLVCRLLLEKKKNKNPQHDQPRRSECELLS